MAPVINLEVKEIAKYSLKTKLSLIIILITLFTVLSISFLANFFINKHFQSYIIKKQEQTTQEIIGTLDNYYNKNANSWDIDSIQTLGMHSLYDGYIIKVYDVKNQLIWDAESHNMGLCAKIMTEISEKMELTYPRINGKFTSNNFTLTQNNMSIGSVDISYFGPYFLNENDFQFLNILNIILISIGIFSFIFSIIIGWLISKPLTNIILKISKVTQKMTSGNNIIKIEEKTNTKELDELISSINYLSDSLNRQENLRKQLTSDVAHELRTPLTTVATHIEAMIEGVWEPTSERLKSCYEEIIRITKIIHDLENIAKIERDNLELKKTYIDLYEIANKVLNSFEIDIKNKNLKVSITGSASNILADRDRISQVIFNLLSNAIKYTPDYGEININFSESEESIIFTVKDSGIGISKDELPFIFERFYRADKSRNRNTGGTGIGLAVVKSIISAHGGKVDVQSKLNEGSCFYVTLPKQL
jgi:signal transduction histidine kinase